MTFLKSCKILSLLIISTFLIYQPGKTQSIVSENLLEECTIGVAAGKATSNHRPLLWKTRDNSSAPKNNMIFNTSYKYNFLSVITVGSSTAWMGLNEKGFAILNSLSSDLSAGNSGPGNGTMMTIALGTCATVADFEHLLDSTNVSGRRTRANFGVIDSTGAAAIFETAGSQYWKFDAKDNQNGYVLRTNFAFNGDAKNGLHDGIYSIERYRRQVHLMEDLSTGDSLNHKSILRYQMRDFSDFDSKPVPVPFQRKWISSRPFGYIYCYVSICRSTSVSASVIQGIQPEESAKLSTMWTILGQPASSVAIPYWPVGNTPSVARGSSTSLLCNKALQIKSLLFDYTENSNYIDSYKLRDENGNGLWAWTFPAEDSIFSATDSLINKWSVSGITTDEMLSKETDFANYALSKLDQGYTGLITSVQTALAESKPTTFELFQNYPNPFNITTTIKFHLPRESFINIEIYNVLGKKISILVSTKMAVGNHLVRWNAEDMSSGIYFCRMTGYSLENNRKKLFSETKILTLLK